MDDHLQVTAKLVKVAKTHVVFEQKVRRGTDTLCEATVKVACVNHTTVKPMAMPSELLARFQMAAILPDNRSE